MRDIERNWRISPSRRGALAHMAGLIAASPIAAAMAAQPDPRPFSEVRRVLGLAEMQTSFDFEPVFFDNVIRSTYDYTAHGDGSEFTLRRNIQAYDWVDIVPTRPAIPVSQVDLSSELFGMNMKFPIIVGPSSGQASLHPDGETGMYKAATAASNTLMMISAVSSQPFTQVAQANPAGRMWAQHYPIQNLAAAERSLNTYQDAGAGGIIVTCDQAASQYERDLLDHNLGARPSALGSVARPTGAVAASDEGEAGGASIAALKGAARYRVPTTRLWYTWQYIDAMRKITKGKLLIKGIMDAQDAKLAIEHGVDGILISNHGGRSMDYGPSTLEVLPEIVAAVNGRVPILFDSGIRRGADIFKALALGANGINLGRVARWGLGAFGQAGAQRVIEIMQQELVQVAAAAGCARLSDINRSMVRVNFL